MDSGHGTSLQSRLDELIDGTLDLLERAAAEQVELDPLATILDRLRARGGEIDLAGAPPVMRMLLSGMLDA